MPNNKQRSRHFLNKTRQRLSQKERASRRLMKQQHPQVHDLYVKQMQRQYQFDDYLFDEPEEPRLFYSFDCNTPGTVYFGHEGHWQELLQRGGSPCMVRTGQPTRNEQMLIASERDGESVEEWWDVKNLHPDQRLFQALMT